MTDRERLIEEVEKHDSDVINGSPLDLGEVKVACHSSSCERCAYLARKAALEKK